MNDETVSVNYLELYNIGVNLFNYSIKLKDNLNKFDEYIKTINDDKIWKSKGRDSILNRYLSERENLNLLYINIKSYSKRILEYVQDIDEFSTKVNKILDKLDEELLWPI